MRALLVCLALLAAPAAAAAEEVSLELVLLSDASRSIDDREIAFQRSGYARAITDPSVLAVIGGTPHGAIAVTFVEWAGPGAEDVVVPWTVIDGATSAAGFAARLTAAPRRAAGRNAIGSALLFAQRMIETNAITAIRGVIDISGDSANSFGGPPLAAARAEVVAKGTVINGLAVVCRVCSTPSGDNLAARFEAEIIGGPGAFVVVARDRPAFAEAVRRKLILEIAGGAGAAERRIAGLPAP